MIFTSYYIDLNNILLSVYSYPCLYLRNTVDSYIFKAGGINEHYITFSCELICYDYGDLKQSTCIALGHVLKFMNDFKGTFDIHILDSTFNSYVAMATKWQTKSRIKETETSDAYKFYNFTHNDEVSDMIIQCRNVRKIIWAN